MHSMVNITLSPETYDIELRRRPIVSTATLRLQAGLAQTQFATSPSNAWRPLRVMSDWAGQTAGPAMSAMPR